MNRSFTLRIDESILLTKWFDDFLCGSAFALPSRVCALCVLHESLSGTYHWYRAMNKRNIGLLFLTIRDRKEKFDRHRNFSRRKPATHDLICRVPANRSLQIGSCRLGRVLVCTCVFCVAGYRVPRSRAFALARFAGNRKAGLSGLVYANRKFSTRFDAETEILASDAYCNY